ncbi:MAG: hypothetical protein WC420_00070 [Candidatus Paceibacterota bacterium]
MKKINLLILSLIIFIIGLLFFIFINNNSINSKIYNSLTEDCLLRCEPSISSANLKYEYNPINGEQLKSEDIKETKDYNGFDPVEYLKWKESMGVATYKIEYFKDKESCVNFCVNDRK